jgi:hypothetical protein
VRIPFASRSYKSRVLPLDSEHLVNWFPEAAPQDAASQTVLLPTPGLAPFATTGAGVARGTGQMGGNLYSVCGSEVWKIDGNGTASRMNGAGLGGVAVAGGGQVIICANPTQLVICVPGIAGYICDGTTVTQITDANFLGGDGPPSSCAFMDGYVIWGKRDTQRFYLSPLNQALTGYDATLFASAEGASDNIVRVFTDHRELWLFGDSSIEVWYNSGASPFPFERISGAFLERGLGSLFAVAKLDNSLFWLGNDGIVYRALNYSPERISDHAIEFLINKSIPVPDAFIMTYTQEGHTFCVLTMPSVPATVAYDVATQVWHKRESFGFGLWRVASLELAFAKVIASDAFSGSLYQLSLDTYTDNGATIQRRAVAPPIHAAENRAFMSTFTLLLETGQGLAAGQGSDPQLMLDWSDDGGRTWGLERWGSAGAVGAYRVRYSWNRMGSFRERMMRVTFSDPVKCAIIAADANVTAAQS